MSVVEDEEKEALKGEQLKGEQSSQTSSVGSQLPDGKRELDPSSLIRRSSWYRMKFMDDQEKEASRSTFSERRSSTKFPNFMELICSVIDSETSNVQEASNQQGWRDNGGQDDVFYIMSGSKGEPVSGGSSGNTFLSKREC
jgi:hypothetical protein